MKKKFLSYEIRSGNYKRTALRKLTPASKKEKMC